MSQNYEQAVENRAATQKTAKEAVRSFYRVRQALGYLGLAFPFLLILTGLLGSAQLEPSVSDFFHTLSRDVFVGTMTAIAIFLIVYEGYELEPGETLSDNWIATIAGIGALGVAFFPNESPSGELTTLTQQAVGIGFSPLIHYTCCLIFFYCMGHICMFKFSKTKDLGRRRIYIASGWAIVFAGTAVGVASYLKHAGPAGIQGFILDYNVVFWIEAFGVWAFSISWLVKGKGDLAVVGSMLNRKSAASNPAS